MVHPYYDWLSLHTWVSVRGRRYCSVDALARNYISRSIRSFKVTSSKCEDPLYNVLCVVVMTPHAISNVDLMEFVDIRVVYVVPHPRGHIA